MLVLSRAVLVCTITALACSGAEPTVVARELTGDPPLEPEPAPVTTRQPVPRGSTPAPDAGVVIDGARLHPDTTIAPLHGLTGDADGGLVAVGSLGTIMVSHDRGERWTQVDSGTTRELFAAWRADDGTTWVTGGNGTILRSRDRGLHWSAVDVGTTANLRHVVGVADELVVAGEEGTILRSTDRGTTWQTVAIPALPPVAESASSRRREPMPTVEMPTPEPSEDELVRRLWSPEQQVLGVASTRPGELWVLLPKLLWRTTDGGAHWQVVMRLREQAEHFEHLRVGGGDPARFVASGRRARDRSNPVDPDHFVAIGRADDPVSLERIVPVRSRLIGPPIIAIAPSKDGRAPEIYLAGDGYDVLWSSDAGATFASSEQSAAMQSPYSLAKRAMWIAPDGTVFAAGSAGALMRSSDRARTWELLVGGAREPLFGGALSKDGEAIYVAVAHAVLRGRKGVWELLAPSLAMPIGGTATTPVPRGLRACCTDVWVGDDGTIVAAGEGQLWRSEDDGKHWTAVAVDAAQTCCWSLWGDGKTVHGAGRDVVMRSIDGGKRWKAHALPNPDGERMVIAGLGDVLYAVGGKGGIVRSDDAGKHWRVEPSGTSEYLYGAFVGNDAKGETTAWAVGEHGTVLRSIAGGAWTKLDAGIETRLQGVWRDASTGELFIVGDVGVLRSTDDGATWAPMLPGHRNLTGVFGDAAGRVLALGGSGEVLRVR